jgi:hypothetical protein
VLNPFTVIALEIMQLRKKKIKALSFRNISRHPFFPLDLGGSQSQMKRISISDFQSEIEVVFLP